MDWNDDEALLDALDTEDENFVPIKPRLKDRPKLNPAEVAESVGPESALTTTYKPSRHEEGWLLSSLAAFYEQNLISHVLYLVKGGKEANVYCCAGGPASRGAKLLAAKVYRPRAFRNLRNDRMYREGRPVLTGEGRPVKATDTRILRALGKKTDFGVQVQHTSWLLYEYTTLQRLHQSGAAVPEPLAAADNAVLMTFYGDRAGAAPTLSEVSPEPELARSLFAQSLKTIEAMLRIGTVHGDLSAYNILCWQNAAVVIDFPQVVGVESNPNAHDIFRRDITRVCDYFERHGVPCDAATIESDLWRRYGSDGTS